MQAHDPTAYRPPENDNLAPGYPAEGALHPVPRKERHTLDDRALMVLSLYQVRQALRSNRITFPSPVPTFARHDRPDLQWRIAQLYFVSGWSSDRIAGRFGILRQRVCQILNTWKQRAIEMGFIQCIPPAENIKLPGRPIQAVISPAQGRTCGGLLLVSKIREGSPEGEQSQTVRRPRRKADILQIVAVLKQLASGRAAGELALETGVTRATVHEWKQKYGALANDAQEIGKLRDENAQLKQMLDILSAGPGAMARPIRKLSGRHV